MINKLKKILDDYDNIVYGEGEPENIEFTSSKKKYKTADFFILLNKKYKIAIIWDLKFQREHQNKHIKTQSLTQQSWDTVLPVYEEIKDWYKVMMNSSEKMYEKVMAMNFETLISNVNDLYFLCEFSNSDSDIPKELLNEKSRTRKDISVWNRNVRFRKLILESYRNQCAICRCNEPKILEAAHIKPVQKKGLDTKENGVCLCRNHHKMFDEELIKINFKTLELEYVSDTVKEMSWYEEFINKYDRKILKRYN